ncbi:MAG: hypothetical protein ACWA41_12605 [Putridiphycobacter sp.]
MDEFNYDKLKKQVRKLCKEQPLIKEYKHSDERYPRNVEQERSFDGEVIPTIGSNSRFQRKSQFIYNVIFSGIYHNNEGDKLKVSDAEIQTKFNKYYRWVEVLESFDIEDEFIQEIYQEARQVLEDEQAELDDFENSKWIEKVLHPDKYLVSLRSELLRYKIELKKIDKKKYELHDSIKYRKIKGEQYDIEMDKLEDGYHLFRSLIDSRMMKYKQKSETAFERKRLRLRGCFEFKDLHNPDPVPNPRLKYRNIVVTSFLVNEYCQWKKGRIRTVQANTREQRKNEKKKQKRADNKSNTPQAIQYEERKSQIRPLWERGINPSKIAKQTEIPKSTVQRIVNDLKENG